MTTCTAAHAADRVYWANFIAGKISYANINGSGGADLTTPGITVNPPQGIAIDLRAGRIYWADYNGNKISYANLDGSGGAGSLNTTGATVSQPAGPVVDTTAGRIYWANHSANKISFANLNGSGGADLTTTGATVNGPVGVALDPTAGRIYWANYAANKISYASLNGTGGGADLNTTGATVSSPIGLAVDNSSDRLFWANNGVAKISYASLNGSGGADLNTTGATTSGVEGVAIDAAAGRIYWANYAANKISYANLNGTGGGADLNTTGATTSGSIFPVLVESVAAGSGAPQVSGGSTPASPLSCTTGSWASDLYAAQLYRMPQSFAYQWTLNGGDISGATAATFTPTEAGAYRCRVTARNLAGSAEQTSGPHAILPLNSFTIGKLKLNRKKGTASLPISLPGPGTVTLGGRGVVRQVAARQIAGAGKVSLTVKSKGKKKGKLKEVGKVKVTATVTYLPSGGVANTVTKKIVLKRKLQP